MSDKIREAQAMHLLNEISEAPNEVAIYACLDRIDVFLGKKEGALEWPVAAIAQQPAPVDVPRADYQATFNAIAAATRIEAGGITISVRAFEDAMLAAKQSCEHHWVRDDEAVQHQCCQTCGAVKQDAEQPDTVKVPRELLNDAAHWLEAHSSNWSAEAYTARELRALLGKESEA